MTETLNSLRMLMAPLVVLICGMLVLLLDLRRNAFAARKALARVCQAGLALAAFACLPALSEASLAGVKLQSADQSPSDAQLFGSGMIQDGFGALLSLTLCLVAALVIGMSGRYLEDKKLAFGEFYALILFATAGAMVMTCALDLINVFVGLEVLSVALYILAGYARRELRSEESAVKYFLLGAFASGFLLYGIALVYGAVGLATHSAHLAPSSPSFTNLITITEVIRLTAMNPSGSLVSSPLFIVGIVLILVGLGFKASLVPFHSYAPDVYQGAPTPVAAFMSAAAKIGAFGALLRLLQCLVYAGPQADTLRNIFWGVALATMLIGNVLAIRQTNIKRMLAFSSVAHAGYLFVGTIASTLSATDSLQGTSLAADSVGFYLLAYSLMNVGAFAVLVWLGHSGDKEPAQLSDLVGLGKRNPAAAATLTVLLLSLAGIPLTAGFLGKVYLFSAAVRGGLHWLAGLGLVISVIGVAYYLNLIVQMYFKEPLTDANPEVRGGAAKNVAVVCAVLTMVLGIVPSKVLGPVQMTSSDALAAPQTGDASTEGRPAGLPNPGMPGMPGTGMRGGGRPGGAPNQPVPTAPSPTPSPAPSQPATQP
jgi:NADH-quinone oxidoreductase subunit N